MRTLTNSTGGLTWDAMKPWVLTILALLIGMLIVGMLSNTVVGPTF